MSRRLKNKPANIICDEEFLKEFPYFNGKIKASETNKMKKWEAIIYKIVKQILSDNDKWYVKYNRDSDTYYIGKEDEKKFIVIDSSHEENIKRRMRKRKNKDSIDEISQELLIKQKNQTKNKQTYKQNENNCSKENRKLVFQKQIQKNPRKTKVTIIIRTEIKQPKPPKKEKLKH